MTQRRWAGFVRTCKTGRETGAHVSALHRDGDFSTVLPEFLLTTPSAASAPAMHP